VLELIKAIRLMGWKHMWKLGHGYRLGWADMMQGYFAHRTMQALLNVGFIDELLAKDRVNVASFAASRGLDKDILNALCEALYSSHLLKKDGLDYRLDSKASYWSRSSAAGSSSAMAIRRSLNRWKRY